MGTKIIFIKSKKVAMFAIAVIICIVASGILASSIILTNNSPAKQPTIVIDAGHGGVDNGVIGVNSKVSEAEINLALALQLQKKLESLGYRVVLTRKTSAGLYGNATENLKMADLTARKKIITEANADLFISIHCNQFPSSDRRGGQVFYDKKHEANANLAKSVQTEINKLNQREVGTTYSPLCGDYYMLKTCDCPAIIIESGFMSNPKDDALLNNKTYQTELITAIINGISGYYSKIK